MKNKKYIAIASLVVFSFQVFAQAIPLDAGAAIVNAPAFDFRQPVPPVIVPPLTRLAVVESNGVMIVIDQVIPVLPKNPPSKLIKPPTPKPATGQPTKANDNAPSLAVLNLPISTLPAPLKPKSARYQELPGLGGSPGSPSDYTIKSVRVGADRNERIYISQQQLNKISTPFETPQVVDTSGASLKAIGQDIFILPNNETPLTIYISDNGTGQSIGITLVPQINLPAQSIVLVPDRPVISGAASSSNAPEMIASDYISRLMSLSKKLASGSLPQGFIKSRLIKSIATDSKAIYEPQYKYSSSAFDVYSYSIKSVLEVPLELHEEDFFQNSVRSVSFFPHSLLQPGDVTTVFIVADRLIDGASK